MRELRVGLVQQRFSNDRGENRRRSAEFLRRAAGQGAQIAVLPELHAGPYFCQEESAANFELAEPVPGPSTEFFGRLARELSMAVVLSVFEKRAAGVYHNTAVVLEKDGGIAGRYRKMHIPDDPGYLEKFYFTPGDLGFRPIVTGAATLGVMVCWDQWYPEAARLMALAGADLLVYPTAIGWDPSEPAEEQARQREAWITVQRGDAIANGIPVLAANRVGVEPSPGGSPGGIRFWGTSFAAGCQGEMLAQAGSDGEELLLVTLDLDRTEAVRRAWPFFRDRRIDAYGDLLKRFSS